MLQSKTKCATISHVLGRKTKHLAQLEAEQASDRIVKRWINFYDRLLEKYGYNKTHGVS